ncbi:FadR/GntR family transcriptional regulator [Xanthomonas arboricola pv. juglandis]|uniref:FadR/GntR family transcriptional regulator n=1 Tax=Xanthomonas arboricola TaxID=56448 RepID=UPI0002DC1975|nr:FCD domain-containing protein [Xanthomonas arboricola]MDN0218559.1 FCD domain-containing protein [Xanthomonas arboricola pv. juglandis]MDN0222808.1 FCD domain-containing protein [Xanthomonas arboricola pv. juglandis]MDN0227083.1 FCD domain-containing protein [Xanthomonas arboricola pv. juglandis]MDN0231639.1 FCD domain-containing protein [Xanthomonas arboricola pv. juglandis]MDN0235584.1 FCD domain-containing protein [Xanthomonas arboricola pv. juglandis]
MSENRLYHSVAAKIRALIDTGEFPVGSRLPGERELAERFGVSRVTVREAEIALEAQGRIVIKIGSGVYVKPRLASDEGALPDVSAFELTAARAVIEAEAAALAASHITDAELDELNGMIQALSAPGLSDAAAADYDRAFHLAIARISGNPVVAHCVQLIWRMRNELPRVREVYARVCHDDGATRVDEHTAILQALQQRDSVAARTAMRNHFQRLFESMLEATENDALAEIRRRTQQDRAHFLAATRT